MQYYGNFPHFQSGFCRCSTLKSVVRS
jgi:hypothetical protein